MGERAGFTFGRRRECTAVSTAAANTISSVRSARGSRAGPTAAAGEGTHSIAAGAYSCSQGFSPWRLQLVGGCWIRGAHLRAEQTAALRHEVIAAIML